MRLVVDSQGENEGNLREWVNRNRRLGRMGQLIGLK